MAYVQFVQSKLAPRFCQVYPWHRLLFPGRRGPDPLHVVGCGCSAGADDHWL